MLSMTRLRAMLSLFVVFSSTVLVNAEEPVTLPTAPTSPEDMDFFLSAVANSQHIRFGWHSPSPLVFVVRYGVLTQITPGPT
eukprot:2643603-Rhodomonas_salina.3